MLIKLTRVQGEERAELWLNADHILFISRVSAGSAAQTLLQIAGFSSNIFVAESPEEIIGLLNT